MHLYHAYSNVSKNVTNETIPQIYNNSIFSRSYNHHLATKSGIAKPIKRLCYTWPSFRQQYKRASISRKIRQRFLVRGCKNGEVPFFPMKFTRCIFPSCDLKARSWCFQVWPALSDYVNATTLITGDVNQVAKRSNGRTIPLDNRNSHLHKSVQLSLGIRMNKYVD